MREGYFLVIEPFVRAREVLRLGSEGANGQCQNEGLCFLCFNGGEKEALKHGTKALRRFWRGWVCFNGGEKEALKHGARALR